MKNSCGDRNIVGVSALRVFAMLLILLYHCLCIYTGIWSFVDVDINATCKVIADVMYQIHLPLFMLIAGYLYGLGLSKGKYQNVRAFVKKKAMRLGLPYVLWGG